jgi:hypothetical protein
MNATAVIRQALAEQERDYAWLHRQTGIKYKTLLAEVKHETRPLGLANAVLIARALGITVPELAVA